MKRSIIITLLVLVMTGCVTFQTKPTPELKAATLKVAVGEGMRVLFKEEPEVGGYACPYVAIHIMPQLQGDCADIELKDWAVGTLSEAAKQWFPDWENRIKAYVAMLDELFDPNVECTEAQMLYLRAFFQGITDACQ